MAHRDVTPFALGYSCGLGLARADTMSMDEIAADIAQQHDLTDEVSECGYACAWVEPYGWVPEADCPIHDAPARDT